MEHVAILKKGCGFLEKILSGEKKIESRWYMSKRAPYGVIKKGDTVYFKETGGSVCAKAQADDVMIFENLTDETVLDIIDRYGKDICIGRSYFENVKGRKYCILVFLSGAKRIEPFDIDKRGFGLMSAWICVSDVVEIKKQVM